MQPAVEALASTSTAGPAPPFINGGLENDLRSTGRFRGRACYSIVVLLE